VESNKKHNVILPSLLFLPGLKLNSELTRRPKKIIFKRPATMKLHVPLNLLIVALTISPALSSPIPIPDGEVGVVE
jgi:hypothetical protein